MYLQPQPLFVSQTLVSTREDVKLLETLTIASASQGIQAWIAKVSSDVGKIGKGVLFCKIDLVLKLYNDKVMNLYSVSNCYDFKVRLMSIGRNRWLLE